MKTEKSEMAIYPSEKKAQNASTERKLKHIHSMEERIALKKEDEEAKGGFTSKNRDFTLTWANLACWSEKIFDCLRRGVAFRVEIHFDPEADIAEINIYEKITASEKADKNPESGE